MKIYPKTTSWGSDKPIDYYDSIQHQYPGNEIIYRRYEEDISSLKDRILPYLPSEVEELTQISGYEIVLFCGQFYFREDFYIKWGETGDRSPKTERKTSVFFLLRKGFKIFDRLVELNETQISDRLFVELEAPIIRIYGRKLGEWDIVKNPCDLQRLGFQSVKPPFVAYQEIERYLGNVLAKEKELPAEITDDKVLLKKHGFDPISSFRRTRHPSKPRRKTGK